MLDIIEKYNLDELVKGKNDVETAIALMRWLCGRYYVLKKLKNSYIYIEIC